MKKIQGTITPALLVITGAFIVVIYALIALLATQLDFSTRQIASESALNISEAGVNYYRWHLAHDPYDFSDGTGSEGEIYEHDYYDPQGEHIGKYALEITPPQDGSSIVTIKSTGWTDRYPNVKRTITTQYGKQSFAKFSFLQNASSWYGSQITVNGEVHSNNGIRMDGTNNSRVSSARETYTCGSETGCSYPTQMPGVWGNGPNHSLWEYPLTPVDFETISFNYTDMRDAADSEGLHLKSSGRQGYHLVFNADGTVRVYRVTRTWDVYGYDGDDDCHRMEQRIRTENLIGTYNVSDIPIIFAEDTLWIDGTIDGRITVVAAQFPVETSETNIWINNNLQYESYTGDDSLGLIAQKDIYFVRDIPNNFIVDGALIAQKGKIIRHGYFSWCGWSSNAVRSSLTMNGAIISYNKSYWNYGDPPSSGFQNRTVNYDGNLLYAPPPYFPTTGDYIFITWKEE